ncbi:hypothetical protein N3K63_03265 [Microbacterium sp. W1N]|uniref:hypothetical protein n=1 Tax=Microbacterium festucae TaxID=2977531 RepID=UPI0021BFD190|nr:hypothetical protein [Microbacterium festucae]MCT9819301.1 hypothetical protein [Microbacterium festucae]
MTSEYTQLQSVVVALDMDGVLRSLLRWPGDPEVIELSITMHRDAYPSTFHSEPPWDEDGTSTQTEYFSRAGVEWVRRLVERGEDVRWATTWQAHANSYFAGPLGLPELPVAVSGEAGGARSSGVWKARQLAAAFPGRPLVWVDDQPDDSLMTARRPVDRALTLIYRPVSSLTGLQGQDTVAIDEWLAMASTVEGQAELRDRRRREVRRKRDRDIRFMWRSREVYRERNRVLDAVKIEFAGEEFIAQIIADHVARGGERARPAISDLLERWHAGKEVTAGRVLKIIDGLNLRELPSPRRVLPDQWAATLGPMIPQDHAAKLLGMTDEELEQAADDLRALRLLTVGEGAYYPGWQISDGQLIPGLQDVLRVLRTGSDDEWRWAAWLYAQDGRGRRRTRRFALGRADAVLQDARWVAAEWRATALPEDPDD